MRLTNLAPCWYCEGTVWIGDDEATCDNCGEMYSPEEFNQDGSRNDDPFGNECLTPDEGY